MPTRGEASARLARAHPWPARRMAAGLAVTSRSPPRSIPRERSRPQLRRLTQGCVGVNTWRCRSAPMAYFMPVEHGLSASRCALCRFIHRGQI